MPAAALFEPPLLTRIDPARRRRLKAAADASKVTLSDLVRHAILWWIRDGCRVYPNQTAGAVIRCAVRAWLGVGRAGAVGRLGVVGV